MGWWARADGCGMAEMAGRVAEVSMEVAGSEWRGLAADVAVVGIRVVDIVARPVAATPATVAEPVTVPVVVTVVVTVVTVAVTVPLSPPSQG